jgi:hypothetical protein
LQQEFIAEGIEGEEIMNLHDPGAQAAGGDFCGEVAAFEADEARWERTREGAADTRSGSSERGSTGVGAADWAKLNCANSSRQAPVNAIFMTLFCR